MAIHFDGRAMVARCKEIRAERLKAVEQAVRENRAYWGRLLVTYYNDHTGRVFVVDMHADGDRVVRDYVVALESIEIR